jgi:hypothetical protein
MSLHSFKLFHYFFLLTLALASVLLSTDSAMAVSTGSGTLGAGDNPWADQGRTPFEIQMTGVINPETEGETSAAEEEMNAGKSIAMVTLGIGQYHETYKFDIVKLESPPNPQLSASMILQHKGKRQYDFELIGRSELLSKVAQAEPGTPLLIVGMYSQRDQKLQLVSVDVVGMDKY